MIENTPQTPAPEDKPPFLSWKRIYQVVIGNLIILLIIFYILTKVLS